MRVHDSESRGDAAHRARRQASSYRFPYHWIPQETATGVRHLRVVSWSHRYLDRLAEVVRVIRELDPQTVLDVGCGDGRLAFEIARSTSASVTGVDPVSQAVMLGRALCADHAARITFVEGDVGDLPEDARFDAGIMLEVLEHVPEAELEPLMSAVAQRIRPGGSLLLSVPTTVLPTEAKHERHYERPLLERHLGPWFRLERCWYRHRVSKGSKMFERLLANRWFAITHVATLHVATGFYRRQFASASAADGGHLMAIASRTTIDVVRR